MENAVVCNKVSLNMCSENILSVGFIFLRLVKSAYFLSSRKYPHVHRLVVSTIDIYRGRMGLPVCFELYEVVHKLCHLWVLDILELKDRNEVNIFLRLSMRARSNERRFARRRNYSGRILVPDIFSTIKKSTYAVVTR